MKKCRTWNVLAMHTQPKRVRMENMTQMSKKMNLEEISWNNHPRRKNKHNFNAGEL